VTVYKPYKRVRIQVLTHAVSREQAEAVQEAIAAVAGLEIVNHSDPADEAEVHQATEEAAHPEQQSGLSAARQQAERAQGGQSPS